MNTSFLESSCNILEAASEYESDEYLVKLVRVQLLAQSISLTLAHGPGSQPSMQLLPVTIVVGSFQEQINALRQSLGPELTTNRAFPSDKNAFSPCGNRS